MSKVTELLELLNALRSQLPPERRAVMESELSDIQLRLSETKALPIDDRKPSAEVIWAEFKAWFKRWRIEAQI